MYLHRLQIKGLRRLQDVDIQFGAATFCIGPNNAGKSSVLVGIDHLLSAKKRIPESEYYSERDSDTGEVKTISNEIVLDAEFRNVPPEADNWRGFRGRVFTYQFPDGSSDSGRSIHYRKTYRLGRDVEIFLRARTRELKAEFSDCKTPQDFIEAGAPTDALTGIFDDMEKAIPAGKKELLDGVDDIWDIGNDEDWFKNPGGIPGNVLARLPGFLWIPAEPAVYEIEDEKKGVLAKTLSELFHDVRDASESYKKAQKHLDELAKELDPEDKDSEFGKMMTELNSILSGVFPESEIHATADLSDPNKALAPSFNIAMSSNIRTPVNQQGTGMVRAAVFAMLRFRNQWMTKRDGNAGRSLIIGFEEPEIYLHPSAANQMRETIYDLSGSGSQIVATTHSPFLIDLSRKPRQVLNRMQAQGNHVEADPFATTDVFRELAADDKRYVKLLMRADDYFARAFFTRRVIIVEGDTEDIVIREVLQRLPKETRAHILAKYEVIKARGKASIIGIATYLAAMGIDFKVMHDRDAGVEHAEKFNEPIKNAVGDDQRLVVLEECMEDILGYEPPSSEKPYAAFKRTSEWGPTWADVPQQVRDVVARLFDDVDFPEA